MTWVRIDDEWPTHPKALAAGLHGRALQVSGLCHCNRHETDGFISDASLRLLIVTAEVDADTPQRLVEVGMWTREEGGYRIHDYLAYNPSHADLETKREAGRERARKSQERKAQDSSRAADAQLRTRFASASGDPSRPVPVTTTTRDESLLRPQAEPFMPDETPIDPDANVSNILKLKDQLREGRGA